MNGIETKEIYATHLFIPTEFISRYCGPSMGEIGILEIRCKVSGVMGRQKHECFHLCLTFKRSFYNPIVNTHMCLTCIDCDAISRPYF